MKFKTGESVKVKKGILCPDDPEFDLSGWHGRIIDDNEDESGEMTIGIAWDSLTLQEMPKRFIEKSEEEGLDWAVMYLLSSDVEHVQVRDSKSDTNYTRNRLESDFGWLSMGEEGKRIQAVINCAKDKNDREIMKVWEKHLKKNLTLPFESIVDEYQSKGPLNEGQKLKVLGIELVDDHYGIMVSCKAGHKRYNFPLADLAAVHKESDNAKQIQDYRVWFANRI